MLKMATEQGVRAMQLAEVRDGSEEFFRQHQAASEIRSQVKGSIFLLCSGQERPSAAIAWRAAWPKVTIYLRANPGQFREQEEEWLITALRQLVQPGLAQANQDPQSPRPMSSFFFSLRIRPLYSATFCLGSPALYSKFPRAVPKAPCHPVSLPYDVRSFSLPLDTPIALQYPQLWAQPWVGRPRDGSNNLSPKIEGRGEKLRNQGKS